MISEKWSSNISQCAISPPNYTFFHILGHLCGTKIPSLPTKSSSSPCFVTQVSPFSCGSDSIVVEKTIVTKEVSGGLPSRPLTQPRETNEVASLVNKT